uniref:Uncharacterized protein n=1 Tax=Oryza sativa subsp. japonica TaxID=39947 RepID=Q6ZA09_ORYSJ|nr:hypothetical protein [Oryza sativa Japonica Group]
MVFPSNAHPERVVEGGGRERDGRNGGNKSSVPAIREGGGGGLSQGGGRGEGEKWNHLGEAELVAQGFGLRSFGEGDRPTQRRKRVCGGVRRAQHAHWEEEERGGWAVGRLGWASAQLGRQPKKEGGKEKGNGPKEREIGPK